jgi:hypothetical protein
MYKTLKYYLPCYKSKSYLNWLKKRNPGKEPHHLLGAGGTGLKSTDYLTVMVDRKQHLTAEKFKEEFFEANLRQALINLIDYVRELENI